MKSVQDFGNMERESVIIKKSALKNKEDDDFITTNKW